MLYKCKYFPLCVKMLHKQKIVNCNALLMPAITCFYSQRHATLHNYKHYQLFGIGTALLKHSTTIETFSMEIRDIVVERKHNTKLID